MALRTLPFQSLADNRRRSAPVMVGCFSSSTPLTNQGTYKYQSSGYCSGICTSRNEGVVGLSNGTTCWCGNELPAVRTKVLDARCDTPCQGYGLEDCGGGAYYFTIWLTGLQDNVPNYTPNATATTLSSTSKATAIPTAAATTTHHTTSAPKQTSSKSSDLGHHLSDKDVAVIIGVVIGLAAFIIMAITFCCLWRRKKRTGTFRRKPSTLLSFESRPSSWASLAPDATISILAGSRKWEGRISATPRRSMQPIAGEDGQPLATSQEHPLSPSPERHSSTYTREDDTTDQETDFRAEVAADNFAQGHPYMSEQNAYPQDMVLPTALRLGNPNRINMLSRHQQVYTSAPDQDMADSVSPMAPTDVSRPIRPGAMVHYPSWLEVSEFDFAVANGDSFRQEPVVGWQFWRERKDGRYELA